MAKEKLFLNRLIHPQWEEASCVCSVRYPRMHKIALKME